MFSSIPRPVFYLSNLTSLDLRGNRLTSISNEIARMTALRELILAENRLTEFPEGIYQLPILENLFINSNKIREIDGAKIVQMKHLSTLNLQNNDLAQVPNELGLAHQIKLAFLMFISSFFWVVSSYIYINEFKIVYWCKTFTQPSFYKNGLLILMVFKVIATGRKSFPSAKAWNPGQRHSGRFGILKEQIVMITYR